MRSIFAMSRRTPTDSAPPGFSENHVLLFSCALGILAVGKRARPPGTLVLDIVLSLAILFRARAPGKGSCFGPFCDLQSQRKSATVDYREYNSDWFDGLCENALKYHSALPHSGMKNLLMVNWHSPSCICDLFHL